MEDLPSEVRSDTLDPLPQVLLKGLPAVAFFGFTSLVTSGGLLIFLTYRIARWYINGELQHGLNQFLLLIYNLLLADVQQAMAFSLTAAYLSKGKIEVGSITCWANGWFVSTGDLASGIFIFSIALHTFFAITMKYKLSDMMLWIWILCAWAFVYAMAVIGVGIDPHLYVRAGAWCWIDQKYNLERLVLHYLWIFVCMVCTVVIYALILLSILAKSSTRLSNSPDNSEDLANFQRAARYVIIFPIAYVLCTLPLAGGRMAAMTGMEIPYSYYCFAGAAITSCGWVDVILYTLTRQALVFSRDPPATTDLGLETFGWSLAGRQWGTITTVEGPLTRTRGTKSETGLARGGNSLSTRCSDEEYFASPSAGVITTKTTVEVHSEPVSQCSGLMTSIVEMEDDSVCAMSPISAS